MTTERLVVVGAGGMARCVLDLVDAINSHGQRHIEVIGVIADPAPDPDALALLEARGISYLGGDRNWTDLPADVGYIIGIGDSRVRRKVFAAALAFGRTSTTLIHPNVHIGHDVQLGEGTVICSHASLENHIRLGRHVHINQNSTIGHDTVLGDFVTVSPLVAISGNVTAQEGVFIGTGTAIREKLHLGVNSTVGMGSVVIRDVARADLVFGNPARVAGGLDGRDRVIVDQGRATTSITASVATPPA